MLSLSGFFGTASAGYAGGIDAVPDWFAAGDMFGVGDFATGCPLGRRCVARETQRFPGVRACHRRLLDTAVVAVARRLHCHALKDAAKSVDHERGQVLRLDALRDQQQRLSLPTLSIASATKSPRAVSLWAESAATVALRPRSSPRFTSMALAAAMPKDERGNEKNAEIIRRRSTGLWDGRSGPILAA